jgi:glycosyltransferase involved in cell wall biosynthesis
MVETQGQNGMSKIVIDAREYTTSTGRYMFRLVQYLEKLSTTDNYVILLKPADMNTYPLNNPRFTKIACPHREFSLDEQWGFKKQLDDLKPDLVHFGKDHQPVLYRGKAVTTMHDLTTARFRNPAKPWPVFKFKQLVYKWVVRRVAKKSVAIMTGSQFVKDDVVKFTGIKPDKVTVTYEAADRIEDKPEPLTELAAKQFLMYVGRPTPHKNLERLIEAFVLLKDQHPELTLVLAGKRDTNYRRIEKSVQKQNIGGVVFTGYINEGQLRWLYEHCAAYVFPSLSEGFGLPGLEAMLHGAPVVSSNATCLPEIYGEAARYFDPLDVQAMANTIHEVLTDTALRAQLVRLGQAQANKYSWQRMAEQTLAVYWHVLNS